jgi:hypothetical protein
MLPVPWRDPRHDEPETNREKAIEKPAAFVKNRTQEPAACEIELQNRDTADTGDFTGFPRYALARRACGGALSEKGGSGGVRSEKGKGSSGVPVTGGARIRWRNQLAGGKLQRKNQGSIFSAGVGEENAMNGEVQEGPRRRSETRDGKTTKP